MLKDLNFKKVYDSDKDDLLNEFYIPSLKSSISYKRITGFFSTSSLLVAAKGIAHLVSNGGKYQLITGVQVSENDYIALSNGVNSAEKLITNNITFNPDEICDSIEKDYLKAVSWLIANNRFQIKVAILTKATSGIFHEKIGILQDGNGDTIAFSGSVNESAQGWINNIEEFKLFKSWIPEEAEYLSKDVNKFNNYWNNCTNNFVVIDLPDAIKNKLLKIKPNDTEFNEIISKFRKSGGDEKKLFDYQVEAINAWTKNNYQGILAMATGTGKTFTALSAISEVLSKNSECCSIIAVPYKHLLTQWAKEARSIHPKTTLIHVYGDNKQWRTELSQSLADYQDGFITKIIILTSYDSLASIDFNEIFQSKYNENKTYLIIADEVHNFGAPQLSMGMNEQIKMRLGLSATPLRYFDETGTDKINKYFSKVVFTYDINEAIKSDKLTPYEYFPRFIEMSESEFEEYLEITGKLFGGSSKDGDENDYIKRLLIKRSKIVKNCINKFIDLENLITELGSDVNHLLIYCDNSTQLEHVQNILNNHNLISHRFTAEESIDEREKILANFDKGVYNCLVAIKCLDEGVDIPSTKIAIILASTSNDREYIQRRGRVLRKYPGKIKSIIYDYIVLPPLHIQNLKIKSIEQKILKKELKRAQEFFNISLNKVAVMNTLSKIMLKYNVFLD